VGNHHRRRLKKSPIKYLIGGGWSGRDQSASSSEGVSMKKLTLHCYQKKVVH
jgi:hypothetical protein